MKVERKKGLMKPKIVEHNKNLLWVILALSVLFIAVVITIIILPEEKTSKECSTDSDCVPSTCCHASSCTSISNSPNCTGIRCTQECKENTLDCNQASCVCLNNKCSVDFKK